MFFSKTKIVLYSLIAFGILCGYNIFIAYDEFQLLTESDFCEITYSTGMCENSTTIGYESNYKSESELDRIEYLAVSINNWLKFFMINVVLLLLVVSILLSNYLVRKFFKQQT